MMRILNNFKESEGLWLKKRIVGWDKFKSILTWGMLYSESTDVMSSDSVRGGDMSMALVIEKSVPYVVDESLFSTIPNADYLRRRYYRRHGVQSLEKFAKKQLNLISNLTTAVEGRMDVAASGILTDVIQTFKASSDIISGSLHGDSTQHHAEPSLHSEVELDSETDFKGPNLACLQSALHSAGVCEAIMSAMTYLGGQLTVSIQCLESVALLCRYDDEDKTGTATCWEAIKSFGVGGMSDLIMAAVRRHKDSKELILAACDAIRSLALLTSNRERLGRAGVCAFLARSLSRYGSDARLMRWVCRAVGHLADNHMENCDRFAADAACETIVVVLQRFPESVETSVEACYAIRTMASNTAVAARMNKDVAPETLLAVFKTCLDHELFAVEACRAMAALMSAADEEVVSRVAGSGFHKLAIRALRKHVDNEELPAYVFKTLTLLAADPDNSSQMVSREVLDNLAVALERHASNEAVAEWGCRFVHELFHYGEIASAKMRLAGMCEMITSSVQRQAISARVSSVGCLALGDLARDNANEQRLTTSGACEAVVGALQRHIASEEVVFNSCYAIHYLGQSSNTIMWMGANGAVEGVVTALKKYGETSREVVAYAVNALASLVYRETGNQQRAHTANAAEAIVNALKLHYEDNVVAEYSCRAIFNLSFESAIVKSLGQLNACDVLAKILKSHQSDARVVTQALQAICGLAIRQKSEVPYRGNVKVMTDLGLLPVVIDIMKAFPMDESVQRSGAMAVAALATTPENVLTFAELGACDIISSALCQHIGSPGVVAKMAAAITTLCTQEVNLNKFTQLSVVEHVITGLKNHEKVATTVSETLRALVSLTSLELNMNYALNVLKDNSFLVSLVLVLRLHLKTSKVALWGSRLVLAAAMHPAACITFGQLKGCDALTKIFTFYATDPTVVVWVCRAISQLSVAEVNKAFFNTNEICTALCVALTSEEVANLVDVTTTVLSVLTTLVTEESNRLRLISNDVCVAVVSVMERYASTSPVVLRMSCEAVYDLCKSTGGQVSFLTAGLADLMMKQIVQYTPMAPASTQLLRAVSGFCSGNVEVATALVKGNIVPSLLTIVTQHVLQPSLIQWCSAAITTICQGKSNPKSGQNAHAAHSAKQSAKEMENQSAVGAELVPALSRALFTHKTTPAVISQVLRAFRAMAVGHRENQIRIARDGIVLPLCVEVLRITGEGAAIVAEHAAWLLANLDYFPAATVSAATAAAVAMSQGGVLPDETRAHRATSSCGRVTIVIRAPVFAADGIVSPSETLLMSYDEMYTSPEHWDVLHSALLQHATIPTVYIWLCGAVAMFAEKGMLPHKLLAETLTAAVPLYSKHQHVLSKLLLAIGAMSFHHDANRRAFGDLGVCGAVDALFGSYGDKEGPVVHGLLPCLIGMTWRCPPNQEKFAAAERTVPSLVALLYAEIENPWVCKAASLALLSLVDGCLAAQSRASALCSFVADVLLSHRNEGGEPSFHAFLGVDQAMTALTQYERLAMSESRQQRSVGRRGSVTVAPVGLGAGAELEPWFWLRVGPPAFTSAPAAASLKLDPDCNIQSNVSNTETNNSNETSLAAAFLSTLAAGANAVSLKHPVDGAGILRVGCQLIAALAHSHIANRNKLGVNDGCHAVTTALAARLSVEAVASWEKPNSLVVYWALRAIGDLAANSPVNQSKLISAGAIDHITQLLTLRNEHWQRVNDGKTSSTETFSIEADGEARIIASALWALANLLPSVHLKSLTPENGGVEIISKKFGGTESFVSRLQPVKNVGTSLGSLLPSKVPLPQRLTSLNTIPTILSVTKHLSDSSVVAPWACRLLYKLSTVDGIHRLLVDGGAMDSVTGIVERYRYDADTAHWANKIKSALEADA